MDHASPVVQKDVPSGLAIASLTLGIVGFLTSFILVGAVLALVGLVLGVIHLRRRSSARRMGWTGVGLSIAALMISAVIAVNVTSGIRKARLAAQAAAHSGLNAWVGKSAPDLELTTLDGAILRLSELKGRRVILDFWASWEPRSVRTIPHLVRLQNDLPATDLTVIGISGQEAGTLRTFVADHGINYPIVSSGRANLPKPYCDVQMLPTKFYIDRNGVIQHVSVGYRSYGSLHMHATEPDLPPSPATGTPTNE